MPELPEVTTTVKGLNEVLPGLTITDAWSDYFVNTKSVAKNTIKNKNFFEIFKKEVVGEKFLNAERRGKNILIHLSGGKTILIHMKMTGHLLFGEYIKELKVESRKLKVDAREVWRAITPGLLQDPFNQFIHFTLSFNNSKTLAFSDMRKFAKVTLFESNMRESHDDLKDLGPEPLNAFTFPLFYSQLNKIPRGLIKTVLMNQTVVAGVGNIYSDEILWLAGVHPERKVETLTQTEVKKMFNAMIHVLHTGIELGGDSMSDYRNIHGERGGFQNSHKAYRLTKQACLQKGCGGTILRKVIGGRSAHFCSVHQK